MSTTVQELAARVIEERARGWDKADPTPAAVINGVLGRDDAAAIRRVVTEAGYTGCEVDEMAEKVTARLIGKLEALADSLPATGAD